MYDIKPLTTQAKEYLVHKRGLSESTLEAYRVGCNYYGDIAIPFIDNNDHISMVKNRAADGGMLKRQRVEEDGTISHYEVKTDTIPGGKPILLGSHLPHEGTIYICYGDYDAMSLYDCGFKGACSMPFGDRGINWIDKQWDFIQSVDKIVFCPDYDDSPKVQAILMGKLDEMSKRLGKHKCFLVPEKAMLGLKDINELYVNSGCSAVKAAIEEAVPVPEAGLSRLVDYHEPGQIDGTPIGIPEIDKATGGHAGGQLSIVSGDNNAGKTTLVLKLLAQFTDLGESSFYWSGEQRPDKLRWWLEQIIAGPAHVVSKVSKNTGREYWYANPEVITTIRSWYGNKIYVYDKRGITPEQFFTVAELAVRRHGVTKLFIDNLMAFTGGEENYFQAQGDFAESCKNFAEDWNVHVTLITHNRKIGADLPDKDSIEGSKKITNWADFVYQLIRINAANKKEEYGDANAIISLCKNRETEHLTDVRLAFDPKSKRLVQYSLSHDINKQYGWESKQDYQLNF